MPDKKQIGRQIGGQNTDSAAVGKNSEQQPVDGEEEAKAQQNGGEESAAESVDSAQQDSAFGEVKSAGNHHPPIFKFLAGDGFDNHTETE